MVARSLLAPCASEMRARKEKDSLDPETAIELASLIKSTASRLYQHGDILGDLAVRLDEASDGVFRLLRETAQSAPIEEVQTK